MKGLFLLATTAVLLGWGSGSAPAAAPQPYEFAGLKLGMTLDEFRRQTPAVPGGQTVCTGERLPVEAELPTVFALPPELAAAGAKRCTYVGLQGDGKLRPLEINIRGVPAETWMLFFAPTRGDAPRLVQINIWIPTSAYGGIVAAFRSAYGDPANQHATATVWSNGVSEIVASYDKPEEALAPIYFIHKALQDSLAKKLGTDQPAKAPEKKKK
jgi:hypothetical protein